MAYENARNAMADMRQHPKVARRTMRDVIAELASDIRATMKKGYSLQDIAETVHKAEGIEIKPRTLATYLRKTKKPSKPAMPRTKEAAAEEIAETTQEA